jgi:cell division septal protein FtsQ
MGRVKVRHAARWVVALATIVLIILVVGAPRVLRALPFFRVRLVEIVGNHYLADTTVVERLHLNARTSVFDPLAPIGVAARAIPGVVAATVTRRLPGTLRVTVREALPVALASVGDRLVLIDYRAHVLPFDPSHYPTSLPLSSRDAATAGLLDRLRRSDADLYASVQWAHIDHGDIVLTTDHHDIRLRPDADAPTLRAITAVRLYLQQHRIGWRELDGRYRERVFVRRGTA